MGHLSTRNEPTWLVLSCLVLSTKKSLADVKLSCRGMDVGFVSSLFPFTIRSLCVLGVQPSGEEFQV